MTVQLDHLIVPAHRMEDSAAFLAEILGLPTPTPSGPFMAVELDNGLTLDFCDVEGEIRPQHYAFAVSEPEFDAIFDRVEHQGLPYWADPRRSRPMEIRRLDQDRGFYFADPSGHFLEVLTRREQSRAVA